MKIRFFAILMIVTLLFAACGNTEPADTQGTKEPTGTSGSNETTTPDNSQEDNSDGVIIYTKPDGQTVIQFPDDVFDDEDGGVMSSRPIDSNVTDSTEPVVTEPSAPENTTSNWNPTVTPDDEFE